VGFATTNKGLLRVFTFRPIRACHMDLSGFIGGFKRCDDAQIERGSYVTAVFFLIYFQIYISIRIQNNPLILSSSHPNYIFISY